MHFDIDIDIYIYSDDLARLILLYVYVHALINYNEFERFQMHLYEYVHLRMLHE